MTIQDFRQTKVEYSPQDYLKEYYISPEYLLRAELVLVYLPCAGNDITVIKYRELGEIPAQYVVVKNGEDDVIAGPDLEDAEAWALEYAEETDRTDDFELNNCRR